MRKWWKSLSVEARESLKIALWLDLAFFVILVFMFLPYFLNQL